MSLASMMGQVAKQDVAALRGCLGTRIRALEMARLSASGANPAAERAIAATKEGLVAFRDRLEVGGAPTARDLAHAAMADDVHLRSKMGEAVRRLRNRVWAYGDMAAAADRATLARDVGARHRSAGESKAFGMAEGQLKALGDALDAHVKAIDRSEIPTSFIKCTTKDLLATAQEAYRLVNTLYYKGIAAANRLIT